MTGNSRIVVTLPLSYVVAKVGTGVNVLRMLRIKTSVLSCKI
jgi:hypothetical protein